MSSKVDFLVIIFQDEKERFHNVHFSRIVGEHSTFETDVTHYILKERMPEDIPILKSARNSGSIFDNHILRGNFGDCELLT